ncbi:MAG: hypothetical protein Q9163_000079 [Psora crenata]
MKTPVYLRSALGLGPLDTVLEHREVEGGYNGALGTMFHNRRLEPGGAPLIASSGDQALSNELVGLEAPLFLLEVLMRVDWSDTAGAETTCLGKISQREQLVDRIHTTPYHPIVNTVSGSTHLMPEAGIEARGLLQPEEFDIDDLDYSEANDGHAVNDDGLRLRKGRKSRQWLRPRYVYIGLAVVVTLLIAGVALNKKTGFKIPKLHSSPFSPPAPLPPVAVEPMLKVEVSQETQPPAKTDGPQRLTPSSAS